MFWLYASLLMFVAVLFIAVPSLFRYRTQNLDSRSLRREANIALFHERSNELESELSEGKLDQQQFDALMRELQRSFLADAGDAPEDKRSAEKGTGKTSNFTDSSRSRWSVGILVIGLLALPAASYILYQQWGAINDVRLMGLFQQTVNNTSGDAAIARELVVELGQRVQENEDQPWAWYFLGENFANLGMFEEAEIAYAQSAARLEDSPDKAVVLGRAALANYINSGLTLTSQTQAIIDEARELNPNEVSVLQLLASDAEQNRDLEKAIQYWRLLIQVNPNSAEAQQLRQSIAAAQAILAGEEQLGPSISLSLSVTDALQLDPGLRVFIAVRNAEQEGLPPLAAKFITVAELPAQITLSDADAVGPFSLSSAQQVTVSALISMSGTANPQPGDYRAVSETLLLDQEDEVLLDLEIAEIVE